MGFCAVGRVGAPRLPPWMKKGEASSSLLSASDELAVLEVDELELPADIAPHPKKDGNAEVETIARPS